MQFSVFKTATLDELALTSMDDTTHERLINEVQKQIVRRMRIPILQETHPFNTAAGTEDYPEPSDLGHVEQIVRLSATTNRPVARVIYKRKVVYDRTILLNDSNSIQSTPQIYTRWEGNMKLFPVPDAIYPMVLDYYELLADLVNPTDENVLLVDMWDVFLYGACARIARYNGDIDQLKEYQGLYQGELDVFEKDEIERKLGDFEPQSMGFQDADA